MKIAKKRKLRKRSARPRYTLAELLAQMPPGRIELDAEMKALESMRPVGREFGADYVDT